MSHFYATIQGDSGEASRRGTKKSGIQGHIRGWFVGFKVNCYIDSSGFDVCEVWQTSGSKGHSSSFCVASARSPEPTS